MERKNQLKIKVVFQNKAQSNKSAQNLSLFKIFLNYGIN